VLSATAQFNAPTFINSKKRCIDLQGAAPGMIGTFDFKAFAVEDHGVVEEVGAGEAEAVVAIGLGEVGIILVIVSMVHMRQALVISIY